MKTSIIILIVFTFFSCSQKERSEMLLEKTASAVELNEVSSAGDVLKQTNTIADPAKIIKNGDIRFQVEDLDNTTVAIEKLIQTHGAFIESAEVNNDRYQIQSNMKVRVPNDRFEILLKELGKHSIYMDFKKISTENVSAEYVDIEARLKTKRAVELRYMEILRKEARTIEDVLNAEDQIRALHEDIEAKVSRMNYLKDQISYSTIHLQCYQKVEFIPAPETFEKKFSQKISEAFFGGWEITSTVFVTIIYLWPLLLLAIIFLIARSYLKKTFRKIPG